MFVDARVSESFTFDFSKKSLFSLHSVCLRLTDFIENGFKVFRIVQDCKNLLTNTEGKAYRKKAIKYILGSAENGELCNILYKCKQRPLK